MPVPVYERNVNRNVAASGAEAGTIGGARSTRLCSPSMGKLGAKRPLANVFQASLPHNVSTTHRMAHGVHASATAPAEVLGAGGGGGAVETESSCVRSLGEAQISAGRQTRRKSVRQTIAM